MQQINLKNPYELPLRDALREYEKLFAQRPIRPTDIKRLEKLNAQIRQLKQLVAASEAQNAG